IQPSTATTHPEVNAVQEKNQEPDDLTQISGIGPKISAILQDAGITNYAQLADADEDEIRQNLIEAGLRLGDPGSWIQQAQALTHRRLHTLIN
ncbi:MAG: helix-hairpin-helix domain-containing protein, partial [Anaerolineales bacterium]